MKHEFRKLIGDGVIIDFNGDFTPYDPGVRYYRDGSGQPPTPAEYDIIEGKLIEGDVVKLIDNIDEYYCAHMEKAKENVKKEILKMLERHDIKLELPNNEWYWIQKEINCDTFVEDLSFKLADEINEQLNEKEFDCGGDY